MPQENNLLTAPPDSTKVTRKRARRAFRATLGRCPYCGGDPAPGHTRCPRCIALQQTRDKARRDWQRTERERQQRESAPRQCPRCLGSNLATRGTLRGRPRYTCRDCYRQSFGDGPITPPNYPCPYCHRQCVKSGHTQTKRPQPCFYCPACRRYNTNLWPANTPSPGGPFPHKRCFHLNYAAQIGLDRYLQTRGLSMAQALRELFIQAAQKPRGYVSRAASRQTIAHRYERLSQPDDDWNDGLSVVTVAVPPTPPPAIPPGGVRFPDLRPEATRKFSSQTGDAFRQPTVLITWKITVALNDAALAGLLAVMRDRNLNHQEAARAILAEAPP